jgi:hypothetical protein
MAFNSSSISFNSFGISALMQIIIVYLNPEPRSLKVFSYFYSTCSRAVAKASLYVIIFGKIP